MDFGLDESCERYDFCKRMVGFQIANELLLNFAGRTCGMISKCENCNAYVEKENKNGCV